MSRTSTSLDLSDFFNNDDSGGLRLAEFLQKRRGGAQGQNFLFMNCEPQRLSLNVQLEELPPLQQNSDYDKQIKNVKNHDKSKEIVSKKAAPEEQNIQNLNDKDISPSKSNSDANNEVPKKNPRLSDKPVSPISPIKPLSLITNVSLSRPPSPLNPISHSRPQSPRLSVRKRTGGVPPSDRLRRRSLSRRFLLQEFESTIGNLTFDPSTCSTPFSQPEKPPLASAFSQSPETENFEPIISGKINSIKDSCCGHTDTLIKSLQRKDEELQMYMENILENTLNQISNNIEKEKCKSPEYEGKTNKTLQSTKSPLKRTYTVEKGSIPGQVILTPDKNISVQNTHQNRLYRSQIEALPNKILTRAQRRLNNSKISAEQSQHFNNLSSRLDAGHNISRKSVEMINESRCTVQLQQQTSLSNIASHRQEVPSTPPQRNVSIVFPTQDVEIAETQESASNGTPAASCNSIIIQATTGEIPLVVIPFNSTYKRNYSEEISDNSGLKAKTKKTKNNNKPAAKQRQQTPEANANQCYQQAEDNLKLTDILTDDDDDTPKSAVFRTIENDSPLNLAASSSNVRKKRLRTCKILKVHNSQLHSNETEKELPPEAHSGRSIAKRKYIPLNKAPGVPLNGERFAQELARMSNYEIIDLRKRNSMGKVFTISGRKSRKSYQEVVKNQIHLEKKIEDELLRRNMDDKTNKGDQESIAEVEINEYLPVPDEFRDSLSKLQDRNDSMKSSFIDEKSSDRVSFKKREDKGRLSKNKKQLPEVLKQYLEGQSDVEETNNSIEDDILKEPSLCNRTRNQTKLCVASPPKSEQKQMTTPRAVSPPPTVSYSFKKSTTHHQHQNTLNAAEENIHDTYTADVNGNKTLLPPPPGFETDSDFSSNYTHINTITTFQQNKTTPPKTNQNCNTDDDHVFKKPVGRPPKSRVQRKREGKVSLQSSTEFQQLADNSSNTTGETLRRSKRSHVPLTQPVPIIQLLFEQTLNKRMLLYEKRKLQKKQKLRENSKTNKQNRDSNSLQSTSSQNSIKASKISKNQKQLSPMPENDAFNTLHQESKILNKNKATHVKLRQRKQKKQVQPTENLESSRIIMATPPPVDHLNIVFDQLRNTSLAPATLKVKPFKIRVARLKSSAQHISSAPVSVTSSSINKNSNFELISWLKNISETDISCERNEIFKEMRISAASNLSFTELQGLEYAFYETEDKASLGYLRFKPRQVKPKKRAKRFHLHFVTLEGKFRVTANEKESIIGVGDMVAIEKLVYYDIENITDDIGILMVIKK